MQNKRGSIELSMTTIIVIIIGLTLLSLGLVWIRSVFSSVEELSSGAFEKGETQIAEIFAGSNEPVSLSPSETKLKQGDTSTASITINNLGENEAEVYAEVEAKAFGGEVAEGLVCGFSDTLTATTSKYTLESGEGATLKVVAEDQGANLGTYACIVTVFGLPEGTETTSLIISVEK